ncbi:glucokinase [Ramlibacter sp. MAHUQ-53]|uniref:glucokinase n=1 Tax=unclassified Ramlibacter TaxID=2617605 RepID=UPI003625401D
MSTPLFPRLLGDIGGTHARFAWQAAPGEAPRDVRVLPCAAYPGLEEAVRDYLAQSGHAMPPAFGMGIATPVLGDALRMTNHAWSFSIRALRQRLGLERFTVVNDFTALALALPALAADQMVQVGGLAPAPGARDSSGAAPAPGAQRAPLALLGPGTGLGVSGLVPVGESGWQAIAGEGGHVTLAAADALEFAVIERLRARHGHVSAERVLSGPGLADLHRALREVRGEPQDAHAHAPLDAAAISRRALEDGDARCLQTLDLFAGFLGGVAGNLALTLGARGGVYLGGGIVPRWLGWFEGSPFRQRFEAKGRFAAYLQDVPVWVLRAGDSPALLGASRALDD